MMTNSCRQYCTIFLSTTFFVCVVFSGKLFADANNQYCDNGVNQNHFDISHTTLESASMDSGSEINFARKELTAGMIIRDEETHSMDMGFNFQYTIIDFDNVLTPMTNGHLHTWNFPLRWRNKGEGHELSYHLVPALAVSSNALKNPDLLDGESMQLWAGLVYKKYMSQNSAWFVGFKSDHRFGRYLAYPVVGLCWQADPDWQIQLALPDFSIRRVFSNGIKIKLFAEPDGNQWHVFSDDKTRDSDFTYDAIVAGLSIEWKINSTVRLELNSIRHARQRLNFVLDDGTPVRSRAESSTGLTVSAGILF